MNDHCGYDYGPHGIIQKELRNLEDASDELMLADDADFIPYPFQCSVLNMQGLSWEK